MIRKLLRDMLEGFESDPADSDYQRGYKAAVEEIHSRLPMESQPDVIRVLRVIEYVGPRDVVEAQVAKSIHGTREFGLGGCCKISVATIGTYPEILEPPAA